MNTIYAVVRAADALPLFCRDRIRPDLEYARMRHQNLKETAVYWSVSLDTGSAGASLSLDIRTMTCGGQMMDKPVHPFQTNPPCTGPGWKGFLAWAGPKTRTLNRSVRNSRLLNLLPRPWTWCILPLVIFLRTSCAKVCRRNRLHFNITNYRSLAMPRRECFGIFAVFELFTPYHFYLIWCAIYVGRQDIVLNILLSSHFFIRTFILLFINRFRIRYTISASQSTKYHSWEGAGTR